MPGNEVAVSPAVIGVPKPIENTLVNVPAFEEPYSWLSKIAATRTSPGLDTTRDDAAVSPPVAPSVAYQTPPDPAVPAPASQNSVPFVLATLRALLVLQATL